MRRLRTALLFLSLLIAATAGARSPGDGYVGCSGGNECIAFDLVSYAIGDTIDLSDAGDYPYDATMRPGGSEVWICGASGDSVVVIDRTTNKISHRIPVGEYPNSVVFTDDDSLALVSARGGDVTLINTSDYSVAGTLDVTTGSGGTYDGPGNMALDPVSGRIYAVDWYDDTLYELAPDASSVLDHVDIGSSLWQLVVDPLGRYVYVTDRGTDVVRVVDTATLAQVREVPVGDDPWGIDVTLGGSSLVVACEDDDSVHVIDTTDWSSTIIALDPDSEPRDVDILDEAGYAFVAGGSVTGPDPVYVITLPMNQLKDTIGIPSSNVNVVAVQEQTTSGLLAGAPETQRPELSLSCFPNPFNPAVTIRYRLPEPAPSALSVYDAAGRLVAALDPRPVGKSLQYEARWDGRDALGREVAAGVYFVSLESAVGKARASIALVK
ncbi:MAG: beta-propeller fold lactonase family protein [Candidatus Eisenbacteria bacterium]|nr:beta-propeller fold lactonase family protein [Candidatus Eisenbacteria bacterium]